jgi:hypothetical protein
MDFDLIGLAEFFDGEGAFKQEQVHLFFNFILLDGVYEVHLVSPMLIILSCRENIGKKYE